jgi:hypothetical protein
MFLDLNKFQISHRRVSFVLLDCFGIGRNARNGFVSIDAILEDSDSFSEYVLAVFHFFSGKWEIGVIRPETKPP